MKRKILSFAVAFVLLFQTFASAGTIYNFLKGNTGALGDPADPFYDPAVGIFYWSKFQDYDSVKPNGGEVTAQVTGAVKSTGGSEAYASSTTAKNFDYKVSIDMSEVQSTYNTLHGYAYAAVSANPTLKTAFDNSLVAGTFTITVTYDSAAITAPSAPYPTSVKYVSDDTTATIYTVGTPDLSTPGTIVIPVTASTTVDALYTTPALLGDIYLELGGWTANVQNSIVSAAMTGYTMIQDTDTVDYAQIDYQSPQSNVTVWLEEGGSHSHGGSSSGTPTSGPNVSGVSDGGSGSMDIPVTNIGGEYYVREGDLPTQDEDGNPIYGWYFDPEHRTPVVPDRNGRVKVKGDTTLYSRTIPEAGAVVDGDVEPADVEKGDDGTYTVDMNDLPTRDGDGHQIYGWDYDEEHENPAIPDADGKLTITGDTLLYPRLRPIARTVVNGTKTPVTVRSEGEDTFTIDVDEIEVPTRPGFVFAGWYTQPNFTDRVSGVTTITKDTELYPRFINVTAPDQMAAEEHNLYVYGYPDGEVKPNGYITREEVAAIFCRLLDPAYRATIETDENPFPDVESTRWSNHDISTMAKGGYIVGDENGNFNPGNPITRAEFTVIASKFAAVDEISENIFSDIEGHWAKDYILKAVGQAWITGYEDLTFRPQNKITRAEAMTIVNTMLVRYGDADSEYATQWPDLDKSDWYYSQVIEATTDHKYVRDENGWSETWVEK